MNEEHSKTLDLRDFYALCDGSHRELYSVLLREWQDTGLNCEIINYTSPIKVGLGVNSVTKNEFLVFFELCAGGADTPQIRLNKHAWRQCLGQEVMAQFVRDLRLMQGLACKERGDVFIIDAPAHALQSVQKQLRNALHHFAVALPNRVAA